MVNALPILALGTRNMPTAAPLSSLGRRRPWLTLLFRIRMSLGALCLLPTLTNPHRLSAQVPAWPTEDSRWLRIDRTSDMVAYVDRLRIHPLGPEVVEIWTLWRFATLQGGPNGFNKVLGRWHLNCPKSLLRQLQAFAYRDSILLAELPLPESPWTSPPPQSIGETLTIRGCLIAQGESFDTVH
jgi:hypothetical protein